MTLTGVFLVVWAWTAAFGLWRPHWVDRWGARRSRAELATAPSFTAAAPLSQKPGGRKTKINLAHRVHCEAIINCVWLASASFVLALLLFIIHLQRVESCDWNHTVCEEQSNPALEITRASDILNNFLSAAWILSQTDMRQKRVI